MTRNGDDGDSPVQGVRSGFKKQTCSKHRLITRLRLLGPVEGKDVSLSRKKKCIHCVNSHSVQPYGA